MRPSFFGNKKLKKTDLDEQSNVQITENPAGMDSQDVSVEQVNIVEIENLQPIEVPVSLVPSETEQLIEYSNDSVHTGIRASTMALAGGMSSEQISFLANHTVDTAQDLAEPTIEETSDISMDEVKSENVVDKIVTEEHKSGDGFENKLSSATPPKAHTYINGDELAEQTEKMNKDSAVGNREDLHKAVQEAFLKAKGTQEEAPVEFNTDYQSPTFLNDLFDNDNVCITASGGSLPVKDETRMLLALFSNGRFFVCETYKFDGKVLGFEYLAKKRHLQIGKPEYVPMPVLQSIYEYSNRNGSVEPVTIEKNDEEEHAQARMQKDFVTIVSRAASLRVSDIHIVVADHTTVMFRTNGLMQTEMEYNKEWGESFVRAAFASSDISDSNYAQNEYQAAQKLGRTPLRGSHGKLVLPRNVLGIRLQFNPIAFGTRYVIMRMLYAQDSSSASDGLESLGFTERELDFFYQLRGAPTGITVVSGPTGSGKSTTLQRNMIQMLQERNYEINLITVEDPPEYPIPGARQMPVTNASSEEMKEREFTKALSAALRSDPDSLMIGEVRTLSSADLAFRGALSGHNVWTTLHANSAPAILMRFRDMGIEDFKLRDPEIMKGLLAQRLFRRICPYCRIPATEKIKLPSVMRLREAFGDIGVESAYLRGKGCERCDYKGVKGRMSVAEIVLPDATFLDLVMKGETKKAINYWINDLNGMTLREVAISHMFRGSIDLEEVERWTGFLNQIVTG